ncbi:MAG TPA: hypothetical protein VIL97_02990 [Thermoanaerobaculia bacterium]
MVSSPEQIGHDAREVQRVHRFRRYASNPASRIRAAELGSDSEVAATTTVDRNSDHETQVILSL